MTFVDPIWQREIHVFISRAGIHQYAFSTDLHLSLYKAGQEGETRFRQDVLLAMYLSAPNMIARYPAEPWGGNARDWASEHCPSMSGNTAISLGLNSSDFLAFFDPTIYLRTFRAR